MTKIQPFILRNMLDYFIKLNDALFAFRCVSDGENEGIRLTLCYEVEEGGEQGLCQYETSLELENRRNFSGDLAKRINEVIEMEIAKIRVALNAMGVFPE